MLPVMSSEPDPETLLCDRQSEVLAQYMATHRVDEYPTEAATEEPRVNQGHGPAPGSLDAPILVDPIDPSLVAGARIKELADAVGAAGPWLADSLATLRGAKPWPKRKCPERAPRVFTAPQALRPEVWSQIQPIMAGLARRSEKGCVAGLFLVDKKQDVKRVIIDARPANAILEPLDGLRLFSLDNLVRAAKRGAGRERMGVFTADFRHFFYQLPVPKNLKPYFVVIGPDGSRVAPIALPMGLHGSPVLAQSVSIAAVLLALRRMGGVFEARANELAAADEMPEEIEAGSLSCMVLLDGLQMIGDAAEVETFASAFSDVCAQFRLRPKEWDLQVVGHAPTLSRARAEPWCSQWPEIGVNQCSAGRVQIRWEFAGVRFNLRGRRARAPGAPREFKWQPATQRTISEVKPGATPRHVAQAVGGVLWRLRVHQEDMLLDHEVVIETASWVGHESGQGWDQPAQLPEGLRRGLNAQVVAMNCPERWTAELRRNLAEKPHAVSSAGPSGVLMAAADADPTQCGGVIWTAEKTLVRAWSLPREDHGQQRAEAAAALRVATECSILRPCAQLLLAVDNEGVREALRRGYAAAPHLRNLIREMWKLPIAIAPVRISGKLNVADDPSRGRMTLDPGREAATRAALEQERRRLEWPSPEA